MKGYRHFKYEDCLLLEYLYKEEDSKSRDSFAKKKYPPLGYKQSEISEREKFTIPISRFFSQFFRKFHF